MYILSCFSDGAPLKKYSRLISPHWWQ